MTTPALASLDTRPNGTTTIVLDDGTTLTLQPEDAATLANHLLRALTLTASVPLQREQRWRPTVAWTPPARPARRQRP